MHTCMKRLLAVGLAAVMSITALAAPASAETLQSVNTEGVIDVFEQVNGIRTEAAGDAPLNLSVTDAAGKPGETVTVSVDLANNPGFTRAKIVLQYAEGLTPVQVGEMNEPLRPNHTQFPKLQYSMLSMNDYNMIVCSANTHKAVSDNGTLYNAAFRIPDDAVPGTSYALTFSDIDFTNGTEKLPLLSQFAEIRVTDASGKIPDPPQNPVTTTTPAVTTSASLSGSVTSAKSSTSKKVTTGNSAATTAVTSTKVTTTGLTTPKVTTATVISTSATKHAETTTVPTTTATTKTTTATTRTETQPFLRTTTAVTTTIATTTTTTRPPLCHGIDISSWQGENVNFEEIKSDPETQFVILRAGFGKYLKQEDTCFQTYYTRAKAAGLPVGAYWYSYATSPEEARIEANVCAQVLGDRQFEYPIAFDIEEPTVLDNQSADEISAIIGAFCEEMEKKGFFSQVYCSAGYLNKKVTTETKNRYDVWVANYNVTVPIYTGPYGMWQYGLRDCKGFTDKVDGDYCYRDYPPIMKQKKLNGFK
ncbi:MAG: hypothetical protein K5705_08505 [Oscillospiraceae bacterium]|nr:hypothetical protein [Oscillospiraceae bacterium]MCR4760290.1 hypothetical protein [Oscillospiraceae bacterium]